MKYWIFCVTLFSYTPLIADNEQEHLKSLPLKGTHSEPDQMPPEEAYVPHTSDSKGVHTLSEDKKMRWEQRLKNLELRRMQRKKKEEAEKIIKMEELRIQEKECAPLVKHKKTEKEAK